MAAKVNLDKLNRAKSEADAKNNRKDTPSIKWFKLDSNQATLRIMPPWTDEGEFEGQFWRVVHQHWHITDTMKAPILCPKNTPFMGGECEICDFVDMLRADSDNVEAQEMVKDIRNKPAYLFTVVDVEDPEYTVKDVSNWKKDYPDKKPPFSAGDAKLQVYAAPFTVYNKVISLVQQGFDLVDLEDGHNIIVTKTGKGDRTKYEVMPQPRSSKVDVPEDHPLIDLSKACITFGPEKMHELLVSGIGSEFDMKALESGNKAKGALKADNKLAEAKKKASPAVKQALEDDEDDEDLAMSSSEEEDDLEKSLLEGLDDD